MIEALALLLVAVVAAQAVWIGDLRRELSAFEAEYGRGNLRRRRLLEKALHALRPTN